MGLLSKVDFSFQDLLFVVLGLFVGVVIGVYFIYNDDENKIFGLIKNDCKTIRSELDKIKQDLKSGRYVKEEALSVLKFYNGRKWKGTGKELTETWDEFYEKYQKSKLIK